MSASTSSPSTTAVSLGGSASSVKIHKIGIGLSIWSRKAVTDEESFAPIKAAIDLVPEGEKLFINSAEFYGGPGNFTASLELLARFFTKYPELADRTFLSVKGGQGADNMFITDGSMQNLRRSIDTINRALDGKKKVDLFECARVDPNTPVEQVMRSLKELSAEGKFDYIGVSETSAATLQKAAAVADIAAVEIEVSPWSYEDETRKVIAIAAERRIPIIAYSPLGRGLLTGKITLETLDQDDPRRRFSRFKEDAMGHNQQIIDALARIAEAKGITMAQFSLAWVCSLGPHMVPIPGSTKVHRIEENFAAAQIKLTEEEVTTIRDIVADIGVKGGRFADLKHLENLWG